MSGLDELNLDHRFLIAEWEQVVLARDINTLPEYAMAPRPGRGVRLSRAQRKQVWSAIERLVTDLAARKRATYVQLADLAAEQLAARATDTGLYAHAVIDEAQDLHPAQWRLLRACVPPGPNDLFLAGDAHQRIYDHKVSLSSLGIETRGRSRRLKINYRTSQSILAHAQSILRGVAVDDLDGAHRGRRRLPLRVRRTARRPPSGFSRRPEEADTSPHLVRGWIDEGVSPSAIGVLGTHPRGCSRRSRRRLPATASIGANWTTTPPATCGSRPCTPRRAWNSRACRRRPQRRRGPATDRGHRRSRRRAPTRARRPSRAVPALRRVHASPRPARAYRIWTGEHAPADWT